MSFSSKILVVLNIIIALFSLALIGLGIYGIVSKNNILTIFMPNIPNYSIGWLIIGLCVLVFTLLAIYGALKKKYFILKLYIFVLGIIFGLEIGGICVYLIVYNSSPILFLDELFNKSLNKPDSQNPYRLLEISLKCCAVNNNSDYSSNSIWASNNPGQYGPSICCKNSTAPTCNTSNTSSDYLEGCGLILLNILQQYLVIILAVVCTIILIQIICLISACFISKPYKN